MTLLEIFSRRAAFLAASTFAGLWSAECACAASPPETLATTPVVLDLPTTLRLAGAQAIDVQLAREKLAEATADYQSACWQFFPWMSLGASYRRHDNLTQDVVGNIIDVRKESYTFGPTFSSQLDIGDAVYKKLAARQLVKAAEFGVESQRQQSIALAAQAYLELVRARAAQRVGEESVKIAEAYVGEIKQAVTAGLAFSGDALRAQLQIQRSQLVLRQTREQQEVAAARLAETLHMPRGTLLESHESELPRLELFAPLPARDALVARALADRPELRESRFHAEAAREAKRGAKFGPLLPSVGAQVFLGGLGGGRPDIDHTTGRSEDYFISLGWRIGPGGLFDRGRVASAESKARSSELTESKIADQIIRQVIESHAQISSLNEQLEVGRESIHVAEEGLRLTRARKSFAVGAVLEDVQAEQDLTRVRLDYLTTLAEYDKAEYTLLFAVGGLATNQSPSSSAVSTSAKP